MARGADPLGGPCVIGRPDADRLTPPWFVNPKQAVVEVESCLTGVIHPQGKGGGEGKGSGGRVDVEGFDFEKVPSIFQRITHFNVGARGRSQMRGAGLDFLEAYAGFDFVGGHFKRDARCRNGLTVRLTAGNCFLNEFMLVIGSIGFETGQSGIEGRQDILRNVPTVQVENGACHIGDGPSGSASSHHQPGVGDGAHDAIVSEDVVADDRIAFLPLRSGIRNVIRCQRQQFGSFCQSGPYREKQQEMNRAHNLSFTLFHNITTLGVNHKKRCNSGAHSGIKAVNRAEYGGNAERKLSDGNAHTDWNYRLWGDGESP